MTLTAKQEKFAQGIADGLAQTEAYRQAFNVPNTSPASVAVKASNMIGREYIAKRVAELREKLTQRHLWTREMSVKALVRAYQEGNGSVKVAAVKELNAMHGFNAPQKVEVSTAPGYHFEVEIVKSDA